MPTWSKIKVFTLPSGLLAAPWHVAVEEFGQVSQLRLTATGLWTVADGLLDNCGPDGYPQLPISPESLILPSAPPGALIGKFGGSTATCTAPAAEGAGAATAPVTDTPFVIGSRRELTIATSATKLESLLIALNTKMEFPRQIRSFSLVVDAVVA